MQPSVLRISAGVLTLCGCLLIGNNGRCDSPPQAGFLATYVSPDGTRFQRIESHIAVDASSRPELIAADRPVQVRYRAELATPTPGQYRFAAVVAGSVTVTIDTDVVLSADEVPAVTLAGQPTEIVQPTVSIDVEYKSPTNAPPCLVLYWSGPDFGFEPVSADVARAERPDERSQLASTGHELFHRLGCHACHAFGPDQAGATSTASLSGSNIPLAPSLAQTPLPLRRPWLVDWLTSRTTITPHPSEAQRDSRDFPHHPRWSLTEQQADSIADTLLAQPSGPPAPASAATTTPHSAQLGDPSRGRQLLLTIGCLACHRYEQIGRESIWSAPDLTDFSRRRPSGFVAPWLSDPAAIQPDHRMPRFPLTKSEIADLAACLETSSETDSAGRDAAAAAAAETTAPSPAESSPTARRLLAGQCAACHQLPADIPATRPNLRFTAPVRPDHACWSRTTSIDRPQYSLTNDQQSALRAYLEWELDRHRPSSTAAPDQAPTNSRPAKHSDVFSFMWRRQQCAACHEHPAMGTGLRSIVEETARIEPGLAGWLPSMLPPSLRTAGDKFRDQAWEDWLRVAPPRRRSWLRVRMPDFHLGAEDAAAIRQFFQLRDRVPDDLLALSSLASSDRDPGRQANRPDEREVTQSHPESTKLSASSLQDASQLVTAQGFGCISCHEIGGVRPAAASLTALGPSLTGLGDRIRPTWFRRWLANPARMVPNIEMPAIQRPVPRLVGGELTPQLNLIWAALNDPAFQPPASAVVRTVQHSGVAAHHEPAVMLTDCIQLPAGMVVHPALCALPNQHNVLIDLGEGHLAAWWAGPAAQQRTAGKSWFWEPATSEYLISRGPASELVLITPDGSFVAGRQGQVTANLDRWESTPQHGLRLIYRVLCTPDGRPVLPRQAPSPFAEPLDDPQATEHGVDRSQALAIHVDQQIQPVWPPDRSPSAATSPAATDGHDEENENADDGTGHVTERSRSGFDRLVTLHPDAAWPGGELRWYLAPADDTGVKLTDPRTIEWTGTGATITLKEPADGQLGSDERGHYARLTTTGDGEQTPIRLVLHYRVNLIPTRQRIVDVAPAPPPLERLEGIPGYSAHRLPLDDRWMPTAMSWSPAGQLFVTSLKGEVWRVTDTDRDGWEDHAVPVSDELAAPYGIFAGPDYLDVIHKSALVRLVDGDRDGRYESATTLASGWGHTADYHDWTIGLLPDDHGGYYVATACQQDERSAAAAQWRGRMLHLRPRTPTDDDPRPLDVHVVSAGHRFPMGMVRYGDDSLLVTDNQGNFNPFNELNHVQPGRRFGFLNRWELNQGLASSEVPPAVCLPHPWTRSVNGIAWLNAPWSGQLVGCEYDTRRLIRISVEEVDGVVQGAAYPLSVAPANPARGFLGPLCCAVSPAGDLYVGGMRDSGWGGGNNTGELVRLKFEPEALPLGIAQVSARAHGFYVEFTRPVDAKWLENSSTYQLESYFRVSTPAYGGDDHDRRPERVISAKVVKQRRGVELTVENLQSGRVYDLRLNLADPTVAESVFPAEAYYTLHRIPH
ncbi:MAG: hypothetical protein U0795_07265 [Pirellulales bacterium]